MFISPDALVSDWEHTDLLLHLVVLQLHSGGQEGSAASGEGSGACHRTIAALTHPSMHSSKCNPQCETQNTSDMDAGFDNIDLGCIPTILTLQPNPGSEVNWHSSDVELCRPLCCTSITLLRQVTGSHGVTRTAATKELSTQLQVPDKSVSKVVANCVGESHSWTTGGLVENKFECCVFVAASRSVWTQPVGALCQVARLGVASKLQPRFSCEEKHPLNYIAQNNAGVERT